jgi:hypothetical protein
MLLSAWSIAALLRAAWELQDARENRSEVIVLPGLVRSMTCKWNSGV